LILGVLGKLDDAVRVREIALVNVLCPRTTCLPTDAEGRPYYRDGHHLGIRGAELLAPLLTPAFHEMRESQMRTIDGDL
jgi:hypothetical protein